MEEPDFWNDPERSQELMKELKSKKDDVEIYRQLTSQMEDMELMIEMGYEENDPEVIPEIQELLDEFETSFENIRMKTLLSGEYDRDDAIVTLHAGAGGTESCDWASMLYRMYTRWASSKGFEVEVLDYLDGEEAGIKSVTFECQGDNAYGYLKAEKGVHRLVRISPFDSSGRRHTSFASLDVTPILDDDAGDIEINPDDIRVDTYRSSGAGGQHVNKTESAIRITHLPTGLVVQSQDERSQGRNKEQAMKVLKSRLYEMYRAEAAAKEASARKSQVGSGDRSERIRTYNFPQGRVTDHRIGMTIYKLPQFIDGDMDEIIEELILAERTKQLAGEDAE